MSHLSVLTPAAPHRCLQVLQDPDAVRQWLGQHGVRFHRLDNWTALPAGSTAAQVQAALAGPIAAACADFGYQSVDVVQVTPDQPGLAALRQRFLAEHVHAEDEARLMVDGAALFYLCAGPHLLVLRLDAGELLAIPAEMPHWFDMGLQPRFTAVRFFTRPDGWVARFTGNPVAEAFADWCGPDGAPVASPAVPA